MRRLVIATLFVTAPIAAPLGAIEAAPPFETRTINEVLLITPTNAHGRPGGGLRADASTPPTANTAYNGPSPVYGGDAAMGETEDSYLARTGHQLPTSTAYGGDPVPGETDDSYFARTGDHVPHSLDT
jgi:hypothetical protein